MIEEIYDIFKRNFPYIVREDDTVIKVLSNSNNKIFVEKNNVGELIGVSVINKNTIYLLCVDKEYRNKGIGTKLLSKSEDYIKKSKYKNVIVGVGDDYLMPGIPTNTKQIIEDLMPDNIYPNVTNDASLFFIKHGYSHSWEDANCFDMRVNLKNKDFPNINIGDTVDGILYRWATIDDIKGIMKCTDNAWEEFTQFYKDKNLYNDSLNQKVLIALSLKEVCGTLIVSMGTERKDLGSVGCTAVSNKYRGKHIGVNMTILGTKYLKSIGYDGAFLGYTYSGLDKMYGYAGYQICVYYNMATKDLI